MWFLWILIVCHLSQILLIFSCTSVLAMRRHLSEKSLEKFTVLTEFEVKWQVLVNTSKNINLFL